MSNRRNAQDQKALRREMERLLLEEGRWLAQPAETLLTQKTAPWKERLAAKVPAALPSGFTSVFTMSFHALFQKEASLLKEPGRQALSDAYRLNWAALERGVTRRALAGFEAQRRKGVLANGAFTAAEGTLLGALGVGLPDIPVYLGVLLRTAFGVSLSYGYDYTQPGERQFLLAALCAAATRGEQRIGYSRQCDDLGRALDMGAPLPPPDEEEWIRHAARALTDRLLLAKFIQGLPLVGAAGGVTNAVLLSQVGKAAAIKYKKRFLYRAMAAFQKRPF